MLKKRATSFIAIAALMAGVTLPSCSQQTMQTLQTINEVGYMATEIANTTQSLGGSSKSSNGTSRRKSSSNTTSKRSSSKAPAKSSSTSTVSGASSSGSTGINVKPKIGKKDKVVVPNDSRG